MLLDELLKAVCVAQHFCRQAGDHLSKSDVCFRERWPVSERPQENGANGRTAPRNWYDCDGLNTAPFQDSLDMFESRVDLCVGNIDRFARFECALDFRIPIQIDDVIPDAGVFVGRNQTGFGGAALAQEDLAAIQAEGLAEPACDLLQNVHKMQRTGDFLEDVNDSQKQLALVFQFENLGL